jgi:predicted short-subunit dehydrogenase-like oxidoreductase (DUF2520 family)
MDIVIIGSGNAAAVLGRKFKAAGHQIVQILSRNAGTASALAYEWDTESANYLTLINRHADVYIVAIPDSAVSGLAIDLRLPGKVVAHTAGAVSMDVLKPVSEHYGVFYPLQSLREQIPALPEIPIFFEGSDDFSRKTLESLARSISPDRISPSDPEQRLRMHVAAVFVNNFTNHLYALAEDYCKKEGLDFTQLLPLIVETATRVREISPSQLQTGPASRNDRETLHRHLDLLKNYPHLKSIYVLLTESIQQAPAKSEL